MLRALLIVSVVANSAQAATLAEIKAAGVLRVGTTGDYKPFSFRDPDGSFRGADIAMMQDLAAHLGVRLAIVPTAWAKLGDDFRAGAFDLAAGGVTITPDRTAFAAFSSVTLADGKRPIARCADRERFTSVAASDQPGVRVVVNPGAANEAFRSPARASPTRPCASTPTMRPCSMRSKRAAPTSWSPTGSRWTIRRCCIRTCAQPTFRPRSPVWTRPYMLTSDPALVSAIDAWLDNEIMSGGWQRALDDAQRQP